MTTQTDQTDDVFNDTPATTDDNPTGSAPPNQPNQDQPSNGVDPVIQKRLNDKDEFIEQLKSEISGMRETIAGVDKTQKEVEELKQELMRYKESKLSDDTQPRDNTNPSLTEQDIQEIVANTITERESKRTATENITAANEKMIAAYGDKEKARQAVRQKADELGLTQEAVRNMAATSPSAFYKLMDVDLSGGGNNDKKTTADTRGTINPNAVNNSGSPKQGTKAYWDGLRRENGSSWYWTTQVQQQIMADKKAGVYDS